MNSLIARVAEQTMSSIDLLEVINSERARFSEPEVRRNDFVARCKDELDGEHYETFVVTNPNGTASEALMLTIDQCMLVAMRESKGVRRAVQERLRSAAVPKTFAAALRLAAEQQERIEEQAKLIEHQRPAVEFVDRYVEARSDKGLREVAKILGIKEREFIAELAASGVIFKQGSNWLPYAEHQHAGRFTVKTGEANGHAFHQMRFTPQGVAWVAQRFAQKSALKLEA